MFYDNFTQDQICGMYTPTHIIVMVCLFVLLFLAVFFSRKMSLKTARIVILVIAIVTIAMEIVKIALRVYKGENCGGWAPLYFCSIFLYASIFIQFRSKVLQNIGWSFIVFGGIGASIGFIIFPSTSLANLPIWHPGSIHSLVYHWLFAYTGFLGVFIKGLYTPRPAHFVYYILLTGLICVISVITNSILGTNFMFLDNPFGMPWLTFVKNYSSTLYALTAFFGQCVALFWGSYFLYWIYIKIKEKIRRKKDESV